MAGEGSTFNICTIEKEAVAGIASALGFREQGNEWFVYRIPRLSVDIRTKFQDAQIQVYMPTYTVEQSLKGRTVRVEKPKILNYLFALTTADCVEGFRRMEEISPVYRHRERDEILSSHDIWLTVPKSQMHSLMIVAQNYREEVTFVTPDDQKLEKGDRVRVIAGEFKGVEGLLITNQGSAGGRVFIAITNGLGAMTTAIPDEHIQVLEFSRSNNHFTRKMQAVEKDLDKAILQVRSGVPLDPKLCASLQFFLFRCSALTNLTHVNNARINSYRYVARVLLGRQAEAEQGLKQFLSAAAANPGSRRALRRSPSAAKYINDWISRLES